MIQSQKHNNIKSNKMPSLGKRKKSADDLDSVVMSEARNVFKKLHFQTQ